jgi:integrase
MKTWQLIYELGEQSAQRCVDCRKRFWVERRPLEVCPSCGAQLVLGVERRQGCRSGFRTKKEAETALNDVLGELQHGTYVQPARITLAEFLNDEWLPAIEHTVRPTTLVGYRCNVAAHLTYGFGATPLQKLTPSAINRLYIKLLSEPRMSRKKPKDKPKEEDKKESAEPEEQPKPLSPTTVRHIHALLHRALGDAVRWGKLQRNPADAADPPRKSLTATNEMKSWSAKQLHTFLDAVKDERLGPLWHVLATTGMRRGEALGLRWADVDLDGMRGTGPTISVRQALVSAGYQVSFSEPKTQKGRRTIALDAGTVSVLSEWRDRQEAEAEEWGKLWTATGLAFTRENGTAWHPDRVSKLFEEAVLASKLPRIRLHDLRHTHATLALGTNIHPKVVSERLGHSTVAFTLDVYSHCIPALAQDAADRVAALVFAAE